MKNDYDPCPQTKLTEAASAGYALFWALLLLLPVHLFSTNPAFRELPRYGSEWRWGIGCITVGFWQAAALLHRRPFFRWLGLLFGGALWGGVASCLGEASRWYTAITAFGHVALRVPVVTGCGTYGWMVAIHLIAMTLLVPYMVADLSVMWFRLHRRLHRWRQTQRRRGCDQHGRHSGRSEQHFVPAERNSGTED